MRHRGEQAVLIHPELRQRGGEQSRDYECRLLKECFRLDLGKHLGIVASFSADEKPSAQVSSLRASGDKGPQMEWDMADLGFKHQVRVINWPNNAAAPGRTKMTADVGQEIAPLLKARYLTQQQDPEPEGEEQETEEWVAWDEKRRDEEKMAANAPQIVAWSEGK